MNIFRFGEVFGQLGSDMAKVRKVVDETKVASYVGQLTAAATDRAAFDAALSTIEDDATLSASEIIAIAISYNRGGKKPTSKAKALATVRKRFVEIVRTDAKNKVAEKARPW
jgi:hypothetical protein